MLAISTCNAGRFTLAFLWAHAFALFGHRAAAVPSRRKPMEASGFHKWCRRRSETGVSVVATGWVCCGIAKRSATEPPVQIQALP
jgi:hypothetical protein